MVAQKCSTVFASFWSLELFFLKTKTQIRRPVFSCPCSRMKLTSALLLAVISASLLAAFALEYPRPAPAFSAEITLQVSDHQHEEMYHGTMYHNSVARQQLIDVPADSFVRLERWDTVRKLS